MTLVLQTNSSYRKQPTLQESNKEFPQNKLSSSLDVQDITTAKMVFAKQSKDKAQVQSKIKRKEKNLGKIKKEQFQIAGTSLQLKLRAAESIDFLKKGKKPVFS